jgi:GDP-L-fucose synthase
MVGSALVRRFQRETDIELLLAGRDQLDLRDEYAVSKFFREEHPDAVIFAAARVGGILANDRYPVEFLLDNVRMAVNAIQAAFENNVKRF